MEKKGIDFTDSNENPRKSNVLSPWEQHASVINLPRFDYRTPSLLLESSHSGFLITCPIKREKSATKEIISILEKVMKPTSGLSLKKRKIENGEKILTEGVEEKNSSHGLTSEENKTPSSPIFEPSSRQNSDLSLVKLARSGLLLLTFSTGTSDSTVDLVSRISCSLDCGDLKKPLWCHRIFPIQETCALKEKELSATVTNLGQNFLTREGKNLETQIKFAVGYNRRGLEKSKDALMLDRDQCFAIVAKAIKELAPDAVVDLNSPQMTVLVEALPVSGLPSGSALAGVSILPSNLIVTKPRLSVKALIAEGNNSKKEKT